MNFTRSEPVEIPEELPLTLTSTHRVGGVRFVAGRGKTPSKVMFIASSVLEEEEIDHQEMSYSSPLADPPEYLKGLSGTVLHNTTNRCGIPVKDNYYTAWVKWLAPKAKRLKPSRQMMEAGRAVVLDEIRRVDPDIIVCMGKPVFDELSQTKFSLGDIVGGWFQRKIEGRARLLFPTECVTKLVTRPDKVSQFEYDMTEASRMLQKMAGVYKQEYTKKYQVISNSAELEALTSKLIAENMEILSIDCEWHGVNYRTGKLRSLQICWAPGEAAYIRFMDDQLNYAFDVDYKEAGRILGKHWNTPKVKLIGHHISADLPWTHGVLGLDWYEKSLLDTEFALQCVDEASALGLERLALAFTDLGRYDLPLLLWKKKNVKLCKGGYGLIPDSIMYDYAMGDVDVVMRAYPHLIRMLKQDYGKGASYRYYRDILNPFVTDVFTSFCLWGLPVDMDRINGLRDLYQYARQELQIELRKTIVNVAEQMLLWELKNILGVAKSYELFSELQDLVGEGDPNAAESKLMQSIHSEHHLHVKPFWSMYLKAPSFKVRSSDDMRLYLFDVKKYMPIKSTNQKIKGMPSMAWAKVLELPPARQREYKPSTDKQTLEILAITKKDRVLTKLLEFKSVDTVCKSFLGEPDVDEETGEVIEEHGLHAYIVPEDATLLGNFSATETGRPRSWKPNTLNLPGWVNDNINAGMADILQKRHKEGTLPEEFFKYVENPKSIPSVRSIVTAPEGYCFVESDYATAELRGWAFISGDQKMIDLFTKKDKCFALALRPDGTKTPVRVDYPEHVLIREPDYRMVEAVEGVVKNVFKPEDLVKDDEGNLIYCKHDLHWSLAEMMHHKPREMLKNKRDRGAAKVANFSCLSIRTDITTHNGSVNIKHVSRLHMLWDGVEWVSHDGVKPQGKRVTIEYKNLRATPDHVVWTECGEMCFGDAALRGIALEEPHPQIYEVQRPSGQSFGGTLPGDGAALPPRNACVESQLRGEGDTSAVSIQESLHTVGSGEVAGRRLQRKGLRPGRQRRSLLPGEPTPRGSQHQPEEHAYIPQFTREARGKVQSSEPGGLVHGENCVEHASAGTVRTADLAEVQGRRLSAPETQEKAGGYQRGRDAVEESSRAYLDPQMLGGKAESGRELELHHRIASGGEESIQVFCVGEVAEDEERESWIRHRRSYFQEVDEAWHDRAASTGTLEVFEGLGLNPALEEVYDIINAGPRRRFTANGYLVSNSAYGASGGTLERKIEADTKETPDEGTGEALLEALQNRQPVAFEFMEDMEKRPETAGYIVSASGRVRHFHLHDKNAADYRTYQGQLSSQGREARNFQMQESVAATAARAAVWLLRLRMKHLSTSARPVAVLYDSAVTLCPVEQRAFWQKAHDLCMFLANGWRYDDRILRYPVDHELNKHWSVNTEEFVAELDALTVQHDPTMKEMENWLDQLIKLFTGNERLSVLGLDAFFNQKEKENS